MGAANGTGLRPAPVAAANQAPGTLGSVTSSRRSYLWLVVIALALTGFSMRTAVTSIGPVLAELQRVFGMSSTVSGMLTTLPVLYFAVFGSVVPWLAARTGTRRLLVVALATMTVGLVARAAVASLTGFFVLSLLALSGGAVANIVLPALIKEEFPERIGQLTALYTSMLAIGMTAGAGLTVPIGSLAPGGDTWRAGLAFWAVFSVVAIMPWLPTLRHDGAHRDAGPSMLSVAGSRTAWLVTLFFGLQAFQAYIAIGWFAKLLNSHGVSATMAGAMIAVFAAVAIPVYLVSAALPQRWHRPTIVVMLIAYIVAYVGLLAAPVRGAWLWMVLVGIGGGEFPLALVMIGLRSRDPRTTSALSAFVQSAGYLIGALGPLLFGVLEQASRAWTMSMLTLIVVTVLDALFGWLAASNRIVDDELARPVAATAAAETTRPSA
jgi:CP family cyanate transporter-like MFS transporter